MNSISRFRRAAIACAIAASFGAHAQSVSDPLAPQDIHVEAGVGSAAPVRAGAADIRVGDASGWTVMTNLNAISQSIGDMSSLEGKTIQEIAEEAQRRAMLVGVVSLSATADPEARVLEIKAENVRVQADGSYARYFRSLDGKPLTQDEFDAKIRIAQSAARFNNDKLEVKLGNVEGGAMPLSISGQASRDERWGGSTTLSTYGQRYSGRDVLTVSGWANVGGDTQITASRSHGLSELRPESAGGNYESTTVEANRATELGVATLRLNDTHYKSGGDLLPYDIHGSSQRIDIELDHPVSAHSSLLFGVGASASRTEMRAAGLEGAQTFAYGMAGYRYQNGRAEFNARIYQGLGGSESYNKTPLGGEFNPNFTALSIDGRYGWDLGDGWALDLSGAAQVGSRGTPGPMQFYGGGIDRGRAFSTGNISGPSGYSASATLSKDLGNGMSVYGGLDYSRVYPDAGSPISQSSAFVGLRGRVGDGGATLDLSLVQPLAAGPGERRDPRLQLMLTIPFN